MGDPYCGPAPRPDELAGAWNFDPLALALLAGIAVAHLAWRRDGRVWLATGIGVLALLYISPLCALTVALFSARALHHVALVGIAAPLLAIAFGRPRGPEGLPGPGWLAALHAAVLWAWHVPPLYDLAVREALPYWAMQASLLGSAFLLWRSVLSAPAGAALSALLATVVQMGMLGALLTFATRPLYPIHFPTTAAFGLSPLADQQLAGLIMWVPAAAPYLLAAVAIAMRLRPAAATATRAAGEGV